MVFNTGETSEELKAKYNPEGSKLRRLQLRMLDMLIYIDKVCKEQNIDWRLDCGNILGAVRHGGFIPWDDDIDIVLVPKEHKRLVAYLKSHPHPQFVLQDNETDPGFYAPNWAVLRDLKSEYKKDTRFHNVRRYKGAQIDIFCYDSHQTKFLFRVVARLTWWNHKYFVGRKPRVAQFIYDFTVKVAIPLAKIIGWPFSSSKVYSHAYGHLASKFHMKWVTKDMVLPHKQIMFEGHSFPGPGDPEKFLTLKYGNYMELPPKERRNHHEADYEIWD